MQDAIYNFLRVKCRFASSCVQFGHERRGRSCCRSDPQRVGPVASLLRVLVRIQRGEGRGKGCRFASPWVNVGRPGEDPAAGHGAPL